MSEKKTYRAVTDYAPRGIRTGKVYELEADDVLIAAGVCRLVPEEAAPEAKPKATRKKK